MGDSVLSGGFWGGRSTPEEPKASSVRQGLRSCLLTCLPLHPWPVPPTHPCSAWASGTSHPPVLSLGLYLHPSSQTTGSRRASTGPGSFPGTRSWLWRGSSRMPLLARTACSWALGLTQDPRASLSTGKGCSRAGAEPQLPPTPELVGPQGALLPCSLKATGAVQEREVHFAGDGVPLTRVIFEVKIGILYFPHPWRSKIFLSVVYTEPMGSCWAVNKDQQSKSLHLVVFVCKASETSPPSGVTWFPRGSAKWGSPLGSPLKWGLQLLGTWRPSSTD